RPAVDVVAEENDLGLGRERGLVRQHSQLGCAAVHITDCEDLLWLRAHAQGGRGRRGEETPPASLQSSACGASPPSRRGLPASDRVQSRLAAGGSRRPGAGPKFESASGTKARRSSESRGERYVPRPCLDSSERASSCSPSSGTPGPPPAVASPSTVRPRPHPPTNTPTADRPRPRQPSDLGPATAATGSIR